MAVRPSSQRLPVSAKPPCSDVRDWIETRELLGHLGICRSTLDRLRQEGVLVFQRHFIKTDPQAARGAFLLNLAAGAHEFGCRFCGDVGVGGIGGQPDGPGMP